MSDSDDLDIPVRRYHSYTNTLRPELSASFRRNSGAGAGAEGGLQSQTREALQQLMHSPHHGDDAAAR